MRAQLPNHRDRAVGALADRQHGVVSREQLLAAGVGGGAVARAVDAGRLRPVFRGVMPSGTSRCVVRAGGWRPCWRAGRAQR